MDHEHLRRWLASFANANGPCRILEEITEYILIGYEQHTVVAECQELVAYISQQLSYWAESDAATTDAALDVLNGLSFTQKGQKALIDCGVCNALCALLSYEGMEAGSAQPPVKRQRLQGEGWLLRVIQLLTTLLLESASRPAPGALSAVAATAAFTALQKVMHDSYSSTSTLGPDHQQAVAAVTARLAMEPAAAQKLWQPQHTCQQQLYSSNSKRHHTGGLDSLLGVQQTAQDFLLSYWETKPCCWSLDGSCVQQQPHQQQPQVQPGVTLSSRSRGQCQQQSADGAAADDVAEALDPVSSIMAALTEESLFVKLLSTAQHCPLMDFAEYDPVQYLQEIYQQKQLLQPLQCNHDIRLIRSAAAAAPLSSPGVAAADPVQLHKATAATEQVLTLPGPVSAADVQAAVSEGFSLVLRDMSKRSRAVAALVNSLEQQLGLPAGANLYYTPAGAQGLKVHYDDHCVFVLQLSGQKTWTVAPPQHCHLPLTYTPRLPVSLPVAEQSVDGCAHSGWATEQQPGQPGWQQQVLLQPGSCLYIPRGWVHQAVAQNKEPQSGAAAAAAAVDAATAPVQQADASTQLPGDGQPWQPVPGSLHLSVGLEVEAWFSVQGFLHCLIQASALRCMAQWRVKDTLQVPSDNVPTENTAALATTEAAASHVAAADPVQQVRITANAAAALLAHVLLVQHANQHAAFRRACPLLVRDSRCKQAAVAAITQHLDAGYMLQQQDGQEQQPVCAPDEWPQRALQLVLQGRSVPDADKSTSSLQTALQQIGTELLTAVGRPSSQNAAAGQVADGSQHADRAATSSHGLPVLQLKPGQHTIVNSGPADVAGWGGSRPLPDVLHWINRVDGTAAAATTVVPHLHASMWTDAMPHTESTNKSSPSMMHPQGPVCADGHVTFATNCCCCWSRASEVLITHKSALMLESPRKTAGNLALVRGSLTSAAAEVLPTAWSHLLAEIKCGQCRQATDSSYCGEATQCLEARQLVRDAQLSVLQQFDLAHCA